MSSFQLRTFALIDRMQPQCAAHIAATCQGDVPIAGMSELFIEVAPGNEVFRVADVALKAADVRPALVQHCVELELHRLDQVLVEPGIDRAPFIRCLPVAGDGRRSGSRGVRRAGRRHAR